MDTILLTDAHSGSGARRVVSHIIHIRTMFLNLVRWINITGSTNINKLTIMNAMNSPGVSIITDEVVDRIARQVVRIKSIVERIENRRKHFEETRYYDIKMLTRRFNLSKSTIHTLVKQGTLPAMSLGGKYIFLKDDIETLLKNYSNGNEQ